MDGSTSEQHLSTSVLKMASPANLVWNLIQCFGHVLFHIFFISIVPILFILYSLCWMRERLTSLIYLGHDQMLSGGDLVIYLDKNLANSIINAVILMRERLTVEEMKVLFLNNVINAKDDNNRSMFMKFTRHVTLRAGYFVWSDKNNFSIDDHIRLHRGQPPRDEDQLKALFGCICNAAFDTPNKPGWEILIIPLEYEQDDAPKTCILFRMDHCIADGISVFRLIIEQMAGDRGAFTPVLNSLGKKQISSYRNRVVLMLERVIRFSYALVNLPETLRWHMFHFDRNILHGPVLNGTHIFDWTTAVNLNHVKDIKNATGTTVNDVFMSCLAATLRKYFVKQSVSPPTAVEVLFLISLHRPDDRICMKNEVSYVTSHLPIEDMNCLQRLRATKVLMDKLKRSPYVIANSWFLKHISVIIPYSVLRFFINKYPPSVIISNLPGPHKKAFFNGSRIESVMALAPVRGSTGVGMLIVSYAGEVTVSLRVDTALISHKEGVRLLLDGFVQEVELLHHSVTSSVTMEKKLH